MRHPADIVSIGIGGNDFGFGDIAAACAVNPITGYVFGDGWANYYSTCQAYYDPSGCPSDDPARAHPRRRRPRRRGDRRRRPDAQPGGRGSLVDYLALAPNRAHAPDPSTYPDSCYESLIHSDAYPFVGTDIEYLAGLAQLMSNTVTPAAANAGATSSRRTPRASATRPATAPPTRGSTGSPRT